MFSIFTDDLEENVVIAGKICRCHQDYQIVNTNESSTGPQNDPPFTNLDIAKKIEVNTDKQKEKHLQTWSMELRTKSWIAIKFKTTCLLIKIF